MTELCIHEFPIGQCSHCKVPPTGVNKTVYVTKGGMAFHNDPKCKTLNSGQAEAESNGLDIHPINPIGWSDAFSSRRPCRNCCPNFKPSK
jgi:hypothetical protein